MPRHPGLASSSLRGPDLGGPPTKGHPWLIAALGFGILRRSTSYIHVVVAASMPLNPLHNDSVRPSEGAVGADLSV
jgi:hypothetical protein